MNAAADERIASPSRRTARVRAIVGLLDRTLPIWDLCCDHARIGSAALDEYPDGYVVFVDRAWLTVERLEKTLACSRRFSARYRLLWADVLRMELPATAANFVVAGVSTNVICAFLERLLHRSGDRIVCNTFQDAARFERRAQALGFAIDARVEVATRRGRQRVWALSRGSDPSGGEGPELF
jgi:tRNA A22 N-methylase